MNNNADKYTATTIMDVLESHRDAVRAFCTKAAKKNELVCIQLQAFVYSDDDDDFEIGVSGAYSHTVEWVEDYYRNNGAWGYCDPREFL